MYFKNVYMDISMSILLRVLSGDFWRGKDEFQVQLNVVIRNSEYLQYVHS